MSEGGRSVENESQRRGKDWKLEKKKKTKCVSSEPLITCGLDNKVEMCALDNVK